MRTVLDLRLPWQYAGELFRPGTELAAERRPGHDSGAIQVPSTTTINENGTKMILMGCR